MLQASRLSIKHEPVLSGHSLPDYDIRQHGAVGERWEETPL